MFVLNYLMIVVVIVVISLLMNRYYEVKERRDNINKERHIHQYLLNDTTLGKNDKPMLWVHVPYECNSRKWSDFQSRKSMELNQPYLYLTTETIIMQCDETFNICLFDDSAFQKIIPNWNINMKMISDPLLSHVRQLAMAKILHIYGGMIVPISFICLKDLYPMFEKGTRRNKMFLCENTNTNITSSAYHFYPDMFFMGAKKDNDTMEQLIHFMERGISVDNTAQIDFLGEFNRWCNTRIYSNETINLIDGKEVGIKTMNNENVLVEDLLSDKQLALYSGMYGLYIPAKTILSRHKYEWFARLSVAQVLEIDVLLVRYLNVSYKADSVVQPNWIDFWSVPLQVSIWGHKPSGLGEGAIRDEL